MDGSRLREPDHGSRPKPPPPPEPEPEPVPEPEKKPAKKAVGSAKKGKKHAEEMTPPPTPPPRPPPPPPPPFTLELARIGAATMTDPDTGARVTTRQVRTAGRRRGGADPRVMGRVWGAQRHGRRRTPLVVLGRPSGVVLSVVHAGACYGG